MDHLLFAAFLLLFSWLVIKTKFFNRSGLSPAQLIIIFLLKVMAGIFYGWVGVYYGEMAQMVDTWYYHYLGLKEYQLLLESPIEFFNRLLINEYENGFTNFLTSKDSWWNDIKYKSFIKLLGIFNLLSFGNYYINVILFSFISLIGPIAIYRVFKDAFHTAHFIILITTLFIPSFLYWNSGLHKDGLLFSGIGILVYCIYFSLKRGKIGAKHIFGILCGLICILALRSFLIGILIPAILAWLISIRLSIKPLYTYVLCYSIYLIIFFSSRYIHPILDFPKAVSLRQAEFASLHGYSAVPVNPLQASLQGFLENFPQAISLSVLRPFPTDVKHLLSLAASIEIYILIAFILICLVFRKRDLRITPFSLFCVFFGVSFLLMIGYTVNFLGAIVRYRSLVFPFLIIPAASILDRGRLKDHISNYKFL